MKSPFIESWVALFHRGIADWSGIVFACVIEAGRSGAECVIESLPQEFVDRLKDHQVIKNPPALTDAFPYGVSYCGPDLSDEMWAADNRNKCAGAQLLHKYFYPD